MGKRSKLVVSSTDSGLKHWNQTTLDILKKDEAFLEEVLANAPELLGLVDRESGVHGPFKVYRQLSLKTPTDRDIRPDLLILSQSGHAVIVEVKRFVNPELRDRRVLAQVVDYVSSLAALKNDQLVDLFTGSSDEFSNWNEFIAHEFDADEAPNELAHLLQEKMAAGKIELIIACDRIPVGLADAVKAVASVAALEFKLRVVEIAPYVRELNKSEILLVPSTKIETQIVARTAVEVIYKEGDSRPAVSVHATSPQDIENNIKASTERVIRRGQFWTKDSVEEAFKEADDPDAVELLRLIKNHTDSQTFVAPGRKVLPTVGLYVSAPAENGEKRRLQIFRYSLGDRHIKIYLNSAAVLVNEQTYAQFVSRLQKLLGSEINTNQKEPHVSIEFLRDAMPEFFEIIGWFSDVAANPEQ